MRKKKSPWRPMSTAPMDGTLILVIETPNGEHFNVFPAAFMNLNGGHPQMNQPSIGLIGWWAVAPSRYSGQGGNCTLPVSWKPLASTPVCWMPMPEKEPVEKLQRRLRFVMGEKFSSKMDALIAVLKNVA
jgi:hypothetical protein